MHDAAGMGALTVDGAMQPPSGGVWRIFTFHGGWVIGIQQKQIRRPDAGEMTLVRIHQKLRAILINSKAEMIGDGFMQIVFYRPSKGTGHINTFFIMVNISTIICD